MRSGRCPKCQSTDIHVGPPGNLQNNLLNSFNVSFWRRVTPERHVCVACGYMEQYIADPSDRRTVAQEWPGQSE